MSSIATRNKSMHVSYESAEIETVLMEGFVYTDQNCKCLVSN